MRKEEEEGESEGSGCQAEARSLLPLPPLPQYCLTLPLTFVRVTSLLPNVKDHSCDHSCATNKHRWKSSNDCEAQSANFCYIYYKDRQVIPFFAGEIYSLRVYVSNFANNTQQTDGYYV